MCAKRSPIADKAFEPIKRLVMENAISHKEIEDFSNIDYPLFSFRYLRENSIKKCRDASFFFEFLMQLRDLSKAGWADIRLSPRHELGMESLSTKCFKPDLDCLSEIVTRDVKKLHVLRADSKNHSFVGLQVGKIFHVFFIEAKFGDVYDHD